MEVTNGVGQTNGINTELSVRHQALFCSSDSVHPFWSLPKLSSRNRLCHLSLYFPQPLGSFLDKADVSYNFGEGIHKKSLLKHMREHSFPSPQE